MAFETLIALSDEAASLCYDLFDLLLEVQHNKRLMHRVCQVCDRANERLWRRQKRAGLLPRQM